jgi:hypothetical protein
MKKLLNQFTAIQEALEFQIENRKEKFDERSDKWQESEKGEEYEALTYELEEWLDNVNESIQRLEEL